VRDPAVAAVIEWWSANARALPWRATRDVYAVWVSEVMSSQTTVARSAAAWERWMRRWPTVHALATASLTDVLAEWHGLGYPRRARDLHRSARIVAASGWPDDLTQLPGVGAYVAAAIRCFALQEPVLPVDVNVRRVLDRRLPGGIDIAGDPWRAGQAIMEFGQRICAARPRCGECPVSDGCPTVGALGGAAAARSAPRARSAPGPGAASLPVRRRRPYEGSVRQRRGRLLGRVLAEGVVELAADDREAARGLVADGLAFLDDAGRLRTPD